MKDQAVGGKLSEDNVEGGKDAAAAAARNAAKEKKKDDAVKDLGEDVRLERELQKLHDGVDVKRMAADQAKTKRKQEAGAKAAADDEDDSVEDDADDAMEQRD